MIAEGLRKKVSVQTLPARLYERAVDRVAARGMASGAVYDALHVECAEAAGCQRLYTYNLSHFERLGPGDWKLLAP
jgi:hypothetical protein